jgi:hypothetical protein
MNSPGTFTTMSGVEVDPGDFSCTVVRFEDIAGALSRQCRWNGHTSRFYSTAQHSVYVAEYLLEYGAGEATALQGLFLNASEAYFGAIAPVVQDIMSIRDTPLWFYDKVITHQIFRALGIAWPIPEAVWLAEEAITHQEIIAITKGKTHAHPLMEWQERLRDNYWLSYFAEGEFNRMAAKLRKEAS